MKCSSGYDLFQCFVEMWVLTFEYREIHAYNICLIVISTWHVIKLQKYRLFKVPITPKYFFRLTKSLHLFETQCAFLPLFNPNIDLLQTVKVTKSGHHLSHDRASKGYGSTPCLTSQTALHACLQRLNTMQISLWRQTGIRPMPLLAQSCERW